MTERVHLAKCKDVSPALAFSSSILFSRSIADRSLEAEGCVLPKKIALPGSFALLIRAAEAAL